MFHHFFSLLSQHAFFILIWQVDPSIIYEMYLIVPIIIQKDFIIPNKDAVLIEKDSEVHQLLLIPFTIGELRLVIVLLTLSLAQ